MRELRSYLGRHQTMLIGAGAEKRAGCRRLGGLVLDEQERRLSWPERKLLHGSRPEDEQ
jgi:hypothetical protein